MAQSQSSRSHSRESQSVNTEDFAANRTSSLHSRVSQPLSAQIPQTARNGRTPKTLTHAYMVCGVGREPSQWVKAPAPTQGKIGHIKGAVNQFWLPEILGSSPRIESDSDIARSLHGAMRACFPHDVEICTGSSQPHCTHHAYVLQQDSDHTLYGIALRVWSRADEKRAETIRELRKKTEPDFYDNASETYWIPYCLSFLSRYPLYNLLGDYLRGMWIHWNKATNLFHAEEVSRILSFPAPRLNDLVRIDMKDYALCYQFPSSATGFQNFSLWPLFSCLSVQNIVGVIEAALSPTRRVILVSHYPAMLTMAAETVRFCVRSFEWSGLYIPIVHARHISELVQEPGPYILGTTAECRTLFDAPKDAIVVDLDRNFVLTSDPPKAFSSGQRQKFVKRLTAALNGEVITSGVPHHLRSAYGGGKLVPAGQIIVMRGEVESVQDPEWWNQDAVMAVMDHACHKLTHHSGLKGLLAKPKKPLMTKISTRHLNEIIRERNQYSRDADEAWQDFIGLKARMDTELAKVTKRNNFLVDELESWKQQFLKFQAFAEQLTKETTDLKGKIESHKRENRRLTAALDNAKDELARISSRHRGTEMQRDDALKALVMQQEVADDLERERRKNKKALGALQHTNGALLKQRDDAQRVVLHLRALIDGQAHHMEHIVKTLSLNPETAQILAASDPENNSPSAMSSSRASSRLSNDDVRAPSRASTHALSDSDPADRQLRDKTDAIAYIIRNISEQCAAAVDGLHIAQESNSGPSSIDEDEVIAKSSPMPSPAPRQSKKTNGTRSPAEYSDAVSSSSQLDRLAMSGSVIIPPTPDLVHGGHRSSTSMSGNSISSVATPDRQSMSGHWRAVDEDVPEVPRGIYGKESGDENVLGKQPQNPVNSLNASIQF